MRYSLIKHGPDGMASVECDDIEQVLAHVDWYGGWTSLEHLHRCIRLWADENHPGDVFCTRTTAIVPLTATPAELSESCPNCGSDDDVDFDDLGPVEDGDVQQQAVCERCGEQWIDVFVPFERRKLFPDPKIRKAWDADREKGDK